MKSNPIKNFFSKDLHIKIFSIIVAIITWFFVMNTITPIESKVFSAPIRFENKQALIDKGYIISNIDSFDNQYVKVTVEATRPSLDELSKDSNRDSIFADVDLSGITVDEDASFPQTFLLSVEPSLPPYLYAHAYTISGYSPSYISVEIDKILSEEKAVSIETTGTIATDYEISSVKQDVENVTVSGPASLMENVARVAAEIDVSNATDNIEATVVPKVYDNYGNEMTDFFTDPDSISVNVYIHKKDTLSIEEPATVGKLPSYLKLKSIDWLPKSVTVTGNEENIAAIDSITLEPVDLSQITGDTTLTRDISSIIEKSGLKLKTSTDKDITIKVSVELVNPVDIVINKEDIKITGLPENKTIELPDTIEISAAGNTNVTSQQLSPTIDVTGLSDGTHDVKLDITVPAGMSIKSDLTVSVVIDTVDAAPDEKDIEVTNEADDDAADIS